MEVKHLVQCQVQSEHLVSISYHDIDSDHNCHSQEGLFGEPLNLITVIPPKDMNKFQ